MEVSLSAQPRLLTLISLAPRSGLRRDFLGSAHNLRPPGCLRSRRRRQRNPAFSHRSRSSRLVFRASLGSQSAYLVVVVALVSVSAPSFVFWNYFKSKKNAREVSGLSNFVLPQLRGNLMNHRVIRSEMMDLSEESRESSHVQMDTEAPLQFHGAALMNKEAVVSNEVESPSSAVLVSGGGYSTFMNGSNVLNQSVSPLVSESTVVEPLHLSPNLNGFQIDKLREEIESGFNSSSLEGDNSAHSDDVILSDSESRSVMEELKINGLSTRESHLVVEIEESREVKEEVETMNYNFLLGEAERKDLHMFYDESKLEGNRTKKINGHKSALDSSALSSPLRNNFFKGVEVSAQFSHTKQENEEGKISFARSTEGPLRTRKDLRDDRVDSRDGRKGIMAHNNHKSLPQLPNVNGLDTNKDLRISEQISVYSRLLSDGRLSDAMDVLEGLDEKGLLNMNKVYHGRFFKICKAKKGVKEAFRFIKLIPNPTLSTYNMLMSVCASSQEFVGAFKVLQLVQENGLKADCKLFTTLISTCAKSGKVDQMFEVFHKMVNAGVEPNLHTYGALIDGCARAGQVAKAFGAYGIMSSKNVKPDRVVFNALISACGQSGAVDRAFDVLAEMGAEIHPIEPDHITIGALMKACANAGQTERAREVYKMLDRYKIKGTPEVYTIAINSCSETGDWEFIRNVYDDMTKKDVVPDEMFLSALIDAAGHAGKLDAAFEIIQDAKNQGIKVGTVSYSSLMGACSNAKDWQKALELYEHLKSIKSKQTVSTVNALITALCDGDQLEKAMEVLSEMKTLGLSPNNITYSILLVASEKKDDLEAGLMLFSQAKNNRVSPNLVMSKCIIGMCLRRYEKACISGEPILSFDSGRPIVVNKWTSSALMAYRETIVSGFVPTIDVLSQVLGCLRLPYDRSLKERLLEDLAVSVDTTKALNFCSLLDGFGEYDPRAFSLLEEAASLGTVSRVSSEKSPIIIDTTELHTHAAEVYILTVLKSLKHRLAAGAKLPSMTILLPVEEAEITTSEDKKTINVAGRVGQAVAALLRRIGLQYQGSESYGKIRISGLSMKRWLTPKVVSPFSEKPEEINLSPFRIGKGITHQQRDIRSGDLSLD